MPEIYKIQRQKEGKTTIAASDTAQPLYKVTAPTALTDNLAGDGAGLLSNGVYYYKVTYILGDGRETEAGTASGGVTVADYTANGQVALTTIPTATNFNDDNKGQKVVARKIYRTEADGSTYKFLVKIDDNTTTTYTDNIADGSLGEDAPSTLIGWDIPFTKLIITALDTNSGYVYLGGSTVDSSDKTGEMLIQGATCDPILYGNMKEVWIAGTASDVVQYRYEQ